MQDMSNDDQEFGDLNLTPERDELRSHGGTSRGASAASSTSASNPVVKTGASGSVKFLLFILLLGMIATGGAGYLFYTQGQAALQELERASNRIAKLENRLSMVGEAAEESSLGFLERVDFNFSEIDKLWAARNSNVKSIATNTSSLEKQDSSLSKVESAVSGQARTLNQNASQFNNLETQVSGVVESLAGVNNLGQELNRLSAEVSAVKSSTDSLNSMTSRVSTVEQDIESINIYRLQTNQKLSALQDSINLLQQSSVR